MRVTATAPDGARYTIVVEPPPTRFGLTCHADDFASHAAVFPRAAWCRVFFEPGDGLLPAGHPKRRLPPGWGEWASFKDPVSEQALSDWLDTITAPTVVTYRHERDNDRGELAQSKQARAEHFARTRAYHQVIAEHRNRPLLTHIPIQTFQWTMATSTAKAVKGDGDWRTWWAGVGDGFGLDAYVDSWAGGYPDPARWLHPMFDMADGVGRRLWLAELGTVLQGGDTGPGRAAWIADVATILRARAAAAALWWCAYGKPGAKGEVRDFHLSDEPSAQAWRAAIERNPA